MIQLPKHRETRTKWLSCVAMTTLVVVVFSICEVSILHADDKSDPAGQKQNPVAKRPKDLTQSDRFEIEDVVDKIEELLDKPDNPPKGVKGKDSESGTTVEVRGPGGKKTIVTKIKKPVENGPTHVIDKADGTSIRVFDEYFEVSGRKSVRVYDRDSGEYLFENPHATSDSAVDQVEPPINQLVSEWIRKFSRGNMSRVEVKHRLRSRGLKLVSVTDPQTNQVTFRARPFTAAEQKTMQLERAKARSARAAWLKKKRSAPPQPTNTPRDKRSGAAPGSSVNPFSGAATAFAEAVLPEGTPVVTAPVVAGSQVRFNEPGTAFVAIATAAAGVVDGPVEERPEDATISGTPEPQVVPIRVASGEVISSDQLVAVLLDSGLGIIPPHVSDSSRLTVHVGRDAVIRERSEAASPGADDKDHAGSRDNDDGETTIAVNNGAVVASVLTDLPYSDLRVGNSEGVKASSRTHIEILVDGQKQGEVATFSQVNPKQFEGKPLQIWTLNEQGQYRRKGEFHGEVVDATLQVRFDKPVYRLGDQGVLLIWNQEAFRRAQEKYRVGGKTNPADWMLKIDASASAAGIPKQAPFSTHRLPFTVVTKGALSATVQAEQQF